MGNLYPFRWWPFWMVNCSKYRNRIADFILLHSWSNISLRGSKSNVKNIQCELLPTYWYFRHAKTRHQMIVVLHSEWNTISQNGINSQSANHDCSRRHSYKLFHCFSGKIRLDVSNETSEESHEKSSLIFFVR